MTGVHLSAALVNHLDDTRWTAAGLESLLRRHAIRRPEVTAATVAALRQWAGRLRTAFEAPDVESRCRAVNALLADGTAGVYVTTHGAARPHLHFTADEDDVLGRVRAVTSGGLAIFAVESAGQRLGECARPGCDVVFVDTSRAGRRRYCSARCGNTDAVHRMRQGRATAGGPGRARAATGSTARQTPRGP
ncbi:MAG: CGNR zinc finger domain-containing protein [Phycicoccus sp.]